MGGEQPQAMGGLVRRTPSWLWVVTLGLLGVLVFLQHHEEPVLKGEQDAAVGLGEIKAPKTSEYILIAKLMFGMKGLMKELGMAGGVPPGAGGATGMSGEDPSVMFVQMSDQAAGWVGQDHFKPVSLNNPPAPPKPPNLPEPAADRLRAAIIAGETLSKEEVEWRVREVEKSLDAKSPLLEDVRTVRQLYGIETDGLKAENAEPAQEAKGEEKVGEKKEERTEEQIKAEHAASLAAAAQLSQDQKDGFRARHGWFADLALSRGDDTSTLRSEAASRGVLVLMVLGAFGFVVLCAGGTGLVLLIVFMVKVLSQQWTWRFARPRIESEWPIDDAARAAHVLPARVALATPGSVWLETVAVFFAMFLGVKGVQLALLGAGVDKDTIIASSLGAQWLVALSIFWPIVRGMGWARWRAEIGWRAPKGVLREIGAGALGYMAGLPVYFGMGLIVVLVTLLVNYFTGSDAKPGGANKILDLVEGGGMWEIILIYLLATVWAPVVEESIFRGCLFRHLRRRTGVVLAGIGSAMVFAVLHGYVIQGLFMVGTLGFWFALMREWRGSIIATATAHAIHNGVVMAVLLIVLSLASA